MAALGLQIKNEWTYCTFYENKNSSLIFFLGGPRQLVRLLSGRTCTFAQIDSLAYSGRVWCMNNLVLMAWYKKHCKWRSNPEIKQIAQTEV